MGNDWVKPYNPVSVQLSFVSPPNGMPAKRIKRQKLCNFGEGCIFAVSEVQLITHWCITCCVFLKKSTHPTNYVAKCHEVVGKVILGRWAGKLPAVSTIPTSCRIGLTTCRKLAGLWKTWQELQAKWGGVGGLNFSFWSKLICWQDQNAGQSSATRQSSNSVWEFYGSDETENSHTAIPKSFGFQGDGKLTPATTRAFGPPTPKPCGKKSVKGRRRSWFPAPTTLVGKKVTWCCYCQQSFSIENPQEIIQLTSTYHQL